jgi:hypothetical protein
MTLSERRVVKEFQADKLPAFKARVEEALGFAVPIEVDWDTLSVPGESQLYTDSWSQIYFEPLIAGLAAVCRDDLGREAVKEGVKKIVVRNTKGCVYGDCWATLQDGALILDHEATKNANATEEREKGLVAVLESGLTA